ncbi:RNA-dependent RNA-polymerase [Lilac chlorotic ringspot-associated virus]|uniref:RNA-directed RNA polymerase L n=1 Tax=Lilac chlorotic ringspot-associated virus TaxID=2719116 RepID=A0A6G8QHH2_9VIRU|nr:RNA-dependent RNA-polymerase [Lilac chlorotic ringspot-associated virus]QIN85945.1 RNA-dependent RNA-polymerase [Lilac chlorotic ringspot-associated virus]
MEGNFQREKTKISKSLADGEIFDDDIVNRFLKLVGKTKQNYTLTSTKREVQNVYQQCVGTASFISDLLGLAERMLYSPPSANQIDFALTIVQLLEAARHDELLYLIVNHLRDSGYEVVGIDFKIKDFFPSINSILTPDILFRNNNGKNFILELKVRNKNTDLKFYYDKYKNVMSDLALICVFNFTDSAFLEFGDYKLTNLLDFDQINLESVIDCITYAKNLRDKYTQMPQYILYTHFAREDLDSDFIDGFSNAYKELKYYEEIKSMYGTYWDEIIKNIEEFDLINNEELTTDKLMQSESDLHAYCVKKYRDYEQHSSKYDELGSYMPTKLRNKNLDKVLDEKNCKSYNMVQNYKPSIYIPIVKTIMLDEYAGSRLKYYRDAFVGIKSAGDKYSRSVINLINEIFNTISIELIMTRDSEIDPKVYHDVLDPLFEKSLFDKTVKYKKIALVSNITSDTTILTNNSFSINSTSDPYMRNNICGYTSKHYDSDIKLKDCLSYTDNIDNTNKLSIHLSKIFNSEHHSGVYLNDLVTLDDMSIRHKDSDIPLTARTKYLEHLYNCHVIFKNIISLNTINSHKFRLLQTPDPGTILILLPNADALKGSPLRYFVINIIEKDSIDDIEANKLLGIYHSHTESDKYTIMISKVISLDVNRLKLLSNSFSKYILLIAYYSQFKKKPNMTVQTMCWLMTQFITISSLTITDSYKNIIMAIYSDYSNIDKLIEDKLVCRPRTLGQIFILKLMINGIIKANDQLSKIKMNKNDTEIDELGEVQNTGFSKNLKLKLPISDISVTNPKEIIHESFILFYLGNKGLHGSPQELLNLYHTPFKFEKEYTEMMNEYKTYISELGNTSAMSFSYEALSLTSKYAYAKLLNSSRDIRNSILKNLNLDDPVLSIKQFSSTKSMVSNESVQGVDRGVIKLPKNMDVIMLEKYIDESEIDDVELYVKCMNVEITKINKERSKSTEVDKLTKLTNVEPTLPLLQIHIKGDVKFIGLTGLRYAKAVSGDFIKQRNTKVFDEFYRIVDEVGKPNLRDLYTDYLDKSDLYIRIFYKDQRTAEDREIYTGNAQTRLCLYPIEMVNKAICHLIPEEAITISGDLKQKRLLDQRTSLLKTKKHMSRTGKQCEIYSVSSDASKWSARDLFPKYILAMSLNPYITKNEKYFLLYLMIMYYDKKVVLTDSAFLNIIKFAKPDVYGRYEEMTDLYKTNNFTVRSNWLQGNLNMTSSFVHYCSTLMTEAMLHVTAEKYHFDSVMTTMVHSDDSTYDFLIGHNEQTDDYYKNKSNIGKFIISLITFSNRHHCITLNEKKTYISTFYKEFLSTTIVNNELFFFYMADLLPIASDTSYSSPMNDFASYNGYINNSFSHACPMNILKPAICIINHLTLATYNMQYTSEKNPKSMIDDAIDLPIQIYPRYKLNLNLAGCIPYYSSDAFNILNDILSMLDKANEIRNSLLEDVIDTDVIDSYIKILEKDYPTKLRYIQYCLLSMDYSQYERDDEDPYNLIDYDLSQKSIINTISLNKGSRIKKTYTYKKYLEDEKNIKLTCAVNPMWCVSKPKDPVLIKSNILSNYSNPTFKDSLIFSKSAIDYGRRIINSNRDLYTLSSHMFEKEKPKKLQSVYKLIQEKSRSMVVDKESLLKYLSIYLFSDKKISASLQIYYSKKAVTMMERPEFTRVIMPKSVYSEEYGRHSINSMFEHLLIEPYCTIEDIDPKAERFISICSYTLARLSTEFKKYESPEDIDEEFREYMQFKYHLDDANEGLIKTHDLDIDYKSLVYTNKLLFQSLMIRYYHDIKKTIDDPKYNIPNYPSPNSLIMTIDSLMKRDMLSTKIYLAHSRANRFDDYWLGRFGMYADDTFYVKFKMGYRIKVATNNLLAPQIKKVKSINEQVLFMNKLISSDQELFNELIESEEFTVGGLTLDELLHQCRSTNDINSNLLLLILNQITLTQFYRVMELNNRVWNYWIMPTNSDPERPDASIAIYNYKSAFLRVETTNIGESISFTMTLAKADHLPEDCLPILLKKVCQDYSSQLKRCILIAPSRESYTKKMFYVNSYGRLARPHDSDKFCVSSINICRLTKIVPHYMTVNDHIRQIVIVESQLFKHEFEFKFRVNTDDDYYINNLIENIDISPDLICKHLINERYIQHHFEYYKEISAYMGPGHFEALYANSSSIKYYSSNIDIEKYSRLVQIGNYIEKNIPRHKNGVVVNLCKAIRNFWLANGKLISGELNPMKFIQSLTRHKFDQQYYLDFYDSYSRIEKDPYEKIVQSIYLSTAQVNITKIIMTILVILKTYPDEYLELSDDVEF